MEINFSQAEQLNSEPLGGRYKVIDQLGEGGFSYTFLAEDLHLPGHPRCVVKRLDPQTSDMTTLQTARRLFETEAQVLYALGSHDQIPRLMAHFEDNREFYLVMELVEGESLKELLADQPWQEEEVVVLLKDILQVLTFVHQQYVIHRDIKPSNLICRHQDEKIVLIDFGAVKKATSQLISSEAESPVTITIGTQGYMPNEQLAGKPRFSSDVYAVGIIGIQALTGIKPKNLDHDPRTGEIIWHHQAAHVNPELRRVLDHMVSYHFKDRYQTAAEALQDLENLYDTSSLPNDNSLDMSFGAEPASIPVDIEFGPGFLAKLPQESADAPLYEHHEPQLTSFSHPQASLSRSYPHPPSRILRTLRSVPWKISFGAGMIAAATFVVTPHLAGKDDSPPSSSTSALLCEEPPLPSLPSTAPDYDNAGFKYYGPTNNQGFPSNGRGILTFPNGDRYDGEFAGGKQSGCGTYKFANGRTYVGQFKDDRFQGMGVWTLENGNQYVGEFKNNLCDGKGTFTFVDGTSEDGIWEKGKLVDGNLSCNP